MKQVLNMATDETNGLALSLGNQVMNLRVDQVMPKHGLKLRWVETGFFQITQKTVNRVGVGATGSADQYSRGGSRFGRQVDLNVVAGFLFQVGKFNPFMNTGLGKIALLAFIVTLLGCSGQPSTGNEQAKTAADSAAATAYLKDRQFLARYHTNLVELQRGDAKALVCPAYQGRVMTSTADGQASYGWINYELIRSGKIGPHMNAFGGEDRFWLGPEGGQYALFFKPGDPFDADHWQTPAVLDSEPFALATKTDTSATFTRQFALTNYAGTRLELGVERTVSLLDKAAISQLLGQPVDSLNAVGIQSANVLTNRGRQAWTEQTGMPSVWILSMLNASPQTTVIVPFRAGAGQPINDSYFGKVPADRLVLTKTAGLFKADARYRSKIGVSPARATNWLGSYNPTTQTLTLVTYSFNPRNQRYVNSAWEQQKQPFAGDVVNAYNDGPMKPGQPQMGQFYEMESSSPAADLRPGASLSHRHTIIHLQGPERVLSAIAQRLLTTALPLK